MARPPVPPVVALACAAAWGWGLPEASGQAAPGAAGPSVSTSTRARSRRPPRVDPRLAAGDGWPAGRVDDQLDQDETLIPFGKGALFVPAMTSGLDEPPVEVLQGGERVAEGTTGRRIVLPPGTYSVRVGSGARQQRMKVQATVRELSTTVIPVSWSALSVHVVDESYNSLRASYELIRVSDREYMGIGFGTDEQAGEPLSTWILRPGLYKIVRVGENYRARRDFVTVRLVRGKHTHFLLVLNEETGEFAGGGEVPEEELFRPQDGFFGSLVVGGDVTMNVRNNALTVDDGISVTAQGFLDGRLAIQLFDNPLLLRLQVEQGLTNASNFPIQKTRDRVDLDGLYLYRFQPWIGPYVQVGAETNLFPGEELLREPSPIVYLSPGGEVLGREVDTTAEISPSFGLVSIREGAGLNVRPFKSVLGEVNLRLGFGARHRITNRLFEEEDCPGDGCPLVLPSARVYRRIDSSDQIGVETAVLATFRLTRYVLVNVEVDSLLTWPLERSIIEAEGSVALKLTSFVSVNYVVRYRREPTLSIDDPNRLEQDILLRFSVDLL